MAYLKGNTYVDGNLYVDGSFRVQQLTDTSGVNLPYLESDEAAIQNRLVKFTSDDGMLNSSYISETVSGDSVNYDFNTPNTTSQITINTNSENLKIFKDYVEGEAGPKLNIQTEVAFTKTVDSTLVALIEVATSRLTAGLDKIYRYNNKVYGLYSKFKPATGTGTTVRTSHPDLYYYEDLLETWAG